jgi:hypothetical protein
MCTENCNGCANSVDDDENIDIESYAGCFEAVVMKIDICIRDMRTFSDCRSSGDDAENYDIEFDYGCVAAAVMMATNGTMMTAVVIGEVIVILRILVQITRMLLPHL